MSIKLAAAAATLLTLALPSSAGAFEPIISLPGEHLQIHPNGALDEILATREQTGGQLGIVILSDPAAGGGPGPAIVHSRQAEFWYVLEGTTNFTSATRSSMVVPAHSSRSMPGKPTASSIRPPAKS
ncbi:MAG: hypothetical protein ABIQ30_04645 [Devosia sp.]